MSYKNLKTLLVQRSLLPPVFLDYVIPVLFSLILLFLISLPQGNRKELYIIEQDEYQSFLRVAHSSLMELSKEEAWETVVPRVETVWIPSSADGSDQPALFYNSGSDAKKPLLVALHSWSADYKQHYSIPYGIWAVKNDWVFIHPDYRGPYTNPQATASELAVQDILDAVEYAKSNARIDRSRVYLTGFSGGGMTTLIMVGRYPSLWTAAAAWVPVYDLVQWYETIQGAAHDYAAHIENSCGGSPLESSEAYQECKNRSASTYLSNAVGKDVQVYIATGVGDLFVPPGHGVQAFNDLAGEPERISPEDISYIDTNYRLPEHLLGEYSDELFKMAGYDLIFSRKSQNVKLQIYDGGHDIVYNAGLFWLGGQKR
ncbi:hypothetical protein CHISP_3245 [Chitinispirillum alkaliphilum]|nr:hypothetical protein CHISP_3245 [Chitinispirillum alkaliphilum]